MTWFQRYRLTHYYRNSIWILPAMGTIAAMIFIRVLHAIEVQMDLRSEIDPSTAMTLLGTLASSMFTLIVFVCSALLITVQLASAQLTPRFISLAFRNPVIKLSLSVFAFTFTFTLTALIRINGYVPLLTAHIASFSCLGSIWVFLYLVDNTGKSLRPSGALGLIARNGKEVIQSVYPQLLSESKVLTPEPLTIDFGQPKLIIPNRSEGVILAFDIQGLVTMAEQAGCVIEMVPQVGDFVAASQPLFRIYGEGAMPAAASLYQSVAVGPERTIEQDPAFAFRMMVDISSKGLSPAINDPTTAVLALDQIQYLLRDLGSRNLEEGHRVDSQGKLRLIYRTPGWDDFVALAVTEVRHFGGTSIQVARRLRAMLEHLILTLPEERTSVLRLELNLLERSTRRFFPDTEDLAMADISDFQGVGSKKHQK